MEKLILRGVMYGADKIPDKWFEKVPGGFYKEKEEKRRRESRGRRDHVRDKSHGRRHRSDDHDDRRRPSDDERDYAPRNGRHAERQRRTGKGASSVDGGPDYDPYFDGDRARVAGTHTKYDTRDDRYKHGDGYDSRDRLDEGRYEPPPLGSHHSRTRGRERAGSVRVAAAAGAAAGAAVARGKEQPPRAAQSTDGPGVYIPYADIYGSVDAARDSVAVTRETNSKTQVTDIDIRRNDRRDRYDDEYDTGYVPPTRPPPQTRQYGSPARDSYDSRPPRAHSERRHPADQYSNSSSRNGSNSGKSKSLESRLKENFACDEKSIRYGGVGALTGAVIGHKLGYATAGAVIGGLGANALGARERFVKDRYIPEGPQYAQIPRHDAHRSERVG